MNMIEYENEVMKSIRKQFNKAETSANVFRVHRKAITWLEHHYFFGHGCDKDRYNGLREMLHQWKNERLSEVEINIIFDK